MEYRLGLLDDEKVLSLSNGEVKNFGKYLDRFLVKKAEINGLFCQRIFGPIVDYTCECGITKKVSNGEICPVCQVPYISSYERNNRFGHIELNTVVLPPLAIDTVAKIWGLSKTKFKEFIVDNKGYIGFVENSEGRFYTDNSKRYKLEYSLDKGENFVDNLYELLLESEKLGINPYISMMENPNQSAQIYFNKGFDIFSMLLSKFPVSPAGMRDRKKVGEELVYHEDNLIYHRIIREALRINSFRNEIEDKKELRELIAQETKIIQKLINGFILTGYRSNTKKLIEPKIDLLNTKEGLLRSEALGKRIDFSGRSVITSGPSLPIDTVGVPMLMLIELFTPDLIRELTKKLIKENKIGKIKALRKAKSLIKEKTDPILYDLVEDISKDYMVMMNRAPSLHRFSVMSFKIKPTFDKVLYFPPMACKPFGADFDGDQLACYIIHSRIAKNEQRKALAFSYNLMSTVDKNTPNAQMGHEMIVGSYLLTKAYENLKEWESKKPIKYYNDSKDIETDYSLGFVNREDKIVLIDKAQNKRYIICVGAGLIHSKIGIIVNYLLGKGGVSKFISTIGNKYDEQPEIAVDLLSKAQTLFFETSTKYGLSIAYHDCKKSEEFTKILEKARYEAEHTPLSELSDIEKQGEKVPLRAVIWDKAFNTCVDRWFKETPQDNALQIMGKAGARVTDVQVKAMILGKGLQSTMDNQLDPNAIYKGLSEGLDPISYMKTCGPARRGFASNMAVVPSSGYGTRQFVTCTRDLSITTDDCGNNSKGIILPKEKALNHYDLNNNLITENNLHLYNDFIEVRSPLTCSHTNGLCKKCCGVNLKNSKDWDLNLGIGTVAAQTIFERLTQASLSQKHCFFGTDSFLDINGKEIRYKDAYKAIKKGHKIYVHSLNLETGKFEVKKVKNAYKERYDDQYVEVTLDNGKVMRSTVDHPYMNRNGELVQAKDLTEGMSLMPYYTGKNDRGYRVIYNNDKRQTKVEGYKLSSNHYDCEDIYDGTLKNGKQVISTHHKDFYKTNDYPTNLVKCSEPQHLQFHGKRNSELIKLGLMQTRSFTERDFAIIAEKNREPWRRELSGKAISKWCKENPELKAEQGRKSGLAYAKYRKENPQEAELFNRRTLEGRFKKSLNKYIKLKKFNVTKDNLGTGYFSLQFIFDNYYDRIPKNYPWFSELDLLSKQDKQNLHFYFKYVDELEKLGLDVTYDNLLSVERGVNFKPTQNIDWLKSKIDLPKSLLDTLPVDYYWSGLQKGAFKQYKAVFLELNKLGWGVTDENYKEMHTRLFGKSTRYKTLKNVLKVLPTNVNDYLIDKPESSSSNYNHKVVSVKVIKLDRVVPFYGIEVEGEWKNYPTNGEIISHNTSGSITIATFGQRSDNLLADFLKYLGARSTQLVPLSMSLIEDTILDLKGESYEEKASNFVLRCDEILKSFKFPVIWYEILGRGLSNIVFKGKRAIGYRHKGYPCDNPEFITMFKANTSSPSWLKGASFGYTKDVIKQAVALNSGTCGLITEKIIEGKNIIDG